MQRGESNVSATSFPRALFLVLFGLTLAVLWVVFGTSHSASADEAPPATPASQPAAPSLLGSVASTVDSVVAVVAPQQPAILTPIAQAVNQSVSSLVTPAPKPVSAAVAPIAHAVDTVVSTVPLVSQLTGSTPVTTITAPVTSTVDDVAGPLLHPVLDGVGPVLAPVVGPVVGSGLDTAVLTPGGPLDHAGAGTATPEATGSGVSRVLQSRSGILLPQLVAATGSSSAGAIHGIPLAPSEPASPFGGSPTDPSIGMLSGSSSASGTASGAASAGLLGGFTLPARALLDSAATPADDSLPTSLTLDPGSSPD